MRFFGFWKIDQRKLTNMRFYMTSSKQWSACIFAVKRNVINYHILLYSPIWHPNSPPTSFLKFPRWLPKPFNRLSANVRLHHHNSRLDRNSENVISPVVFPNCWGHFGQPILPKSHDDHPGPGVSGWRMLDAVAVKSCTEAWCGRAEESRWPLNAGRVGSNQPILFFLGRL